MRIHFFTASFYFEEMGIHFLLFCQANMKRNPVMMPAMRVRDG